MRHTYAWMRKNIQQSARIGFLGKLLLVLFAGGGVFSFVSLALAQGGPTVGQFVNYVGTSLTDFIANGVSSLLANVIIPLLGKLLTVLVSLLVSVSQYNGFVDAPAVVNGWVVMRDAANMFFVIVLLIIAFATIIGRQEYQWEKLLPKLLLMAIFINFSRTIAGVMIDAAQVVMITFVNGYSAAAGGNFANALQITQLLKFSDTQLAAGGVSPSDIASALILAAILAIVSIVVILVMLLTLVYRMVMLWLLIVTAPMTWFLNTFPQGQKYYAKWWQEFQNQVIVGPVLAFFLWLSLASVGSGDAYTVVDPDLGKSTNAPFAGISAAATSSSILSYIISIGLLVGGLQTAQSLGSSFAGSGLSWIKGKAKGAIKGAVGVAKFGLGAADLLQAQATGIQFAKVPEKFKKGWQTRTQKLEQKAEERGLSNLQGLRKVPGFAAAGVPLSLLMDPGGFAKNVLALNGVVARNRQALLGSWLDKKVTLGMANRKKEKAEEIRKDIKEEEEGGQTSIAQAKTALDQAVQQKDAVVKKRNDARQRMDEGRAAYELSREAVTQTPMGYALARQAGLVDKDVTEQGFMQMNRESIEKIKGRAHEQGEKWQDQERMELENTIAQAPVEIQTADIAIAARRQDVANAEAAHEAGSADRENRERKAGSLDESARSWNAAYLRGEPDYKTRLEQTRTRYEQEAYKNVDISRSTEELMGDLERGLAQGDKALVTLISKELSKRGSSDSLFEKFGIKETGKDGLKRYAEEVLGRKAGVDDDYAKKTAMRMASNEAEKGNIHFKGALKADPITRDIYWQGKDDMMKAAASSMKGKTVRSAIDSTSVGALEKKTPDGKTELSPQSMSFLEKLDSNVSGLKKIINDGNMKPEMLRLLYNQLDALRQLQGAGKLSEEFVNLIADKGSNVPPSVATDPGKVAVEMYQVLHPAEPNTPTGGTP